MPYNIMEVDGVPPENSRFPVSVHPAPHDLAGPEHEGQLVDAQIPAFVMRDDEHQLDPHTMIIDGRDVSVDGAKLDTIETGAEVNNISDQQAASLTSGSHSSWHHHDDWYYRKSELFQPGQSSINWLNLIGVPTEFNPIEHNHDDRYYTEDELTAIIGNYYNSVQLDAGQLDHRYYTESEVDNILSSSYFSQTELLGGAIDDRYFTESEITTNYYDKTEVDAIIAGVETFGIKAGVDTYTDLPATETENAIYIVRQTVEPNDEGFYKYESGSWYFLSRNTGNDIGSHNELQNLNLGDFLHLTNLEYTGLTGGGQTALHHHDDRYYTESEIDDFLNNISPTSHNHDDRYYTKIQINADYYNKNQLNTGQLDNRYYTETEIDNLLAGYSEATHNHEDLYYEKSYIDQLASMYSLNTHHHDDLYYRKADVDAKDALKADLNHIHDDRYFTESELGNNSGISGASRIGVSLIGGITANNVQDALQTLKNEIDSSANTLQEAYNAGPSITSDGPVIIDSTSSTKAPLQLSNRSSAPTDGLSAGQMAIIDNELYIFNVDKNKWLTPSKSLGFGRYGSADGHVLMAPGGVRDDNSGYQMRKQGTIIGVTMHSTTQVANKNIYIRLNKNTVHTVTTDVNGDIQDDTLNIDFDSGDVVSVVVSSAGSPLKNPVLAFDYCWRA
jgi:hypothetical protein